jgi:serine/threonine-protein kinase
MADLLRPAHHRVRSAVAMAIRAPLVVYMDEGWPIVMRSLRAGLFVFLVALVSATALTASVGSAQSIDGAMFRGGPAHTGSLSGSGPDGDPAVLAQAAFDTDGTPGPISVVSASGTLYAAIGPDVVALDPETLEERWHFATDSSFSVYQAIPAVVDGVVYTGTNEHAFAIDAESGAEIWRAPLTPELGGTGPTTVADGVVYLPTTGSLVALDAATGEVRWSFPIDDGVHTAATVADGVVYIGGYDEVFHAIDAETGGELWKWEADDIFSATAAVVDGVVYVASVDGIFTARDAATGDELWRYEAEDFIESSAAVVDGVVYVGEGAGYLTALDAATGAVLWQVFVDQEREDAVRTSPTVVDGVVYAVADGGMVAAFDATTGDVRWQLRILDDPRVTMGGEPHVADGRVYVGYRGGALVAIG